MSASWGVCACTNRLVGRVRGCHTPAKGRRSEEVNLTQFLKAYAGDTLPSGCQYKTETCPLSILCPAYIVKGQKKTKKGKINVLVHITAHLNG